MPEREDDRRPRRATRARTLSSSVHAMRHVMPARASRTPARPPSRGERRQLREPLGGRRRSGAASASRRDRRAPPPSSATRAAPRPASPSVARTRARPSTIAHPRRARGASSSGSSASAIAAGCACVLHELGAPPPAGDHVHETDVRDLNKRRAIAYVESVRTVRDDERAARPPPLRASSCRSCTAPRRRAQQRERLPTAPAETDSAPDRASRRRDAHDDLQSGHASLQLLRRGDEARRDAARSPARGCRERARAPGRRRARPSVRRAAARSGSSRSAVEQRMRRRTSRRCHARASSGSSNGRITAAFVTVRASFASRPARHAHTCGVM